MNNSNKQRHKTAHFNLLQSMVRFWIECVQRLAVAGDSLFLCYTTYIFYNVSTLVEFPVEIKISRGPFADAKRVWPNNEQTAEQHDIINLPLFHVSICLTLCECCFHGILFERVALRTVNGKRKKGNTNEFHCSKRIQGTFSWNDVYALC